MLICDDGALGLILTHIVATSNPGHSSSFANKVPFPFVEHTSHTYTLEYVLVHHRAFTTEVVRIRSMFRALTQSTNSAHLLSMSRMQEARGCSPRNCTIDEFGELAVDFPDWVAGGCCSTISAARMRARHTTQSAER